ncbi:MAG: PilZ domain-containing protein [Candidatus Omnitrophota bacterium]
MEKRCCIKERRKFKRVNITALARWKKYPAKSQNVSSYPAIIKNISEGGICISSYTKLDVGEKILANLVLPNRDSVSFYGQVVWEELENAGKTGNSATASKYVIGIKIINIDPVDRKKINKLTFLKFLNSK